VTPLCSTYFNVIGDEVDGGEMTVLFAAPAAPAALAAPTARGRSFAVVEDGKWVGSARAAFDGIVLAHDEALLRRSGLMNEDAFGAGWMLIVKPASADWRAGLVTGAAIAPAFDAWFATEPYKDRGG
jgi:glycine cleavage system H protein